MSYTKTFENLITITACSQCKASFAIPKDLYISAKRNTQISFYCPYGHGNCYPESESDAEKYKRLYFEEMQRLKIEKDRHLSTERRLIANKGQITKLRNRVANGVCPCCNRTFANLSMHMSHKHPEFKKE